MIAREQWTCNSKIRSYSSPAEPKALAPQSYELQLRRLWFLSLWTVTPKPANKLHAEVRTSHVIVADLSTPANCQSAVDSTVEKFGRLDALVNNAGVNDSKSESWARPPRKFIGSERGDVRIVAQSLACPKGNTRKEPWCNLGISSIFLRPLQCSTTTATW